MKWYSIFCMAAKEPAVGTRPYPRPSRRGALVALLIALIGMSCLSKIAYLDRYGIHEDVMHVLVPARQLLTEGSLRHSGLAMPMQVLRDHEGDLEELEFPFWLSYLGPLFYFAPFISWFGAGTVSAFLAGQTVLLLSFVALFIAVFRSRNALHENLLLLLLLLAFSLDGSFYLTPTQMVFNILLLILFQCRGDLAVRPGRAGLLLGLAFQFRPEALALGIAMATGQFLGKPHSSRTALIRKMVLAAVCFAAVSAAFLGLRHVLDAAPAADHKTMVLGGDVLEEGFGVFFGSEIHETTELLRPGSILKLGIKTLKPFASLFAFRHHLTTHRPDAFILLFLIFYGAVFYHAFEREKRRDLVYLGVFVFGHLGLSAMGSNLVRYLDSIFLLIIFFLAEHLRSVKQDLFSRTNLGSAVAVSILLVSAAASANTARLALGMTREQDHLRVAAQLKRSIPPESRVMLRHPELWLWYAGGRQAVAFKGVLPIEERIYAAYQPQGVIVLTRTDQRIPGRVRDLTLVLRTELSAGQGVSVYAR